MIYIKSTAMKKMPEYCDDCVWYTCRPHPQKGWSNICELESHCMDDDVTDEWVYDGNGRPKACPLVESTVCDIDAIRSEIGHEGAMFPDGEFFVSIDRINEIIDKYREEQTDAT